MEFFNNNRRLQAMTLAALDWGLYMRQHLDAPLVPFMFLRKGEVQHTRMLVTEGNPLDYATKILETEEAEYDLIAIGMEGYLHTEAGEKVDALMIYGFDVTLSNGVALAQMFSPKEKNSAFEKIESAIFLGNPDLIVPLKDGSSTSYAVESVGFKGTTIEKNGRLVYLAFLTHNNPSVLAETIQKFIYHSLSENQSGLPNGLLELEITPGLHGNGDFLAFVIRNVLVETKKMDFVQEWETKSGYPLRINCRYGQLNICQEFGEVTTAASQDKAVIPSATPDVSTKEIVADVLESDLEKGEKKESLLQEGKKPWWNFWKGQ